MFNIRARRILPLQQTLGVICAGMMLMGSPACSREDVKAEALDGGDGSHGDAGAGQGSIVASGVEYVFPDDTLTDWVSFTDQLAEVEILDERMIATDRAADDPEHGGYIPRKLDVSISRVIWVRPGFEPFEGTIELGALGWVGSEKGPPRTLVAPSAARLVPGGRYVAPLLYDRDAWSMLTARCAFAADGNIIAESDVAKHGHNAIAAMLSGMSHEAIAELFEASAPYPGVAENWEKPASERLRIAFEAMPK